MGDFSIVVEAKRSKSAAGKQVARQRITAELSIRERMQLALYLGHRSKAFRDMVRGKLS